MRRRTFLAGGAAVPLRAVQKSPGKAWLVLTWIRLRNSPDEQLRRTSEFLTGSLLPALKRAGAGPVGLFNQLIGEQSPAILTLAAYPGFAHLERVGQALEQDPEYRKAAAEFYGRRGLAYQRLESSLLRAFEAMPRVEPPPAGGRQTPRIFELRTYESDNPPTLRRKIDMFEQGEIALFRRLGMLPVFFGETLIGPRMPNLTYMLAFDSLAAREKAWQTFAQDPEWQKMRVKPGWADAEIVSNISSSLLRPLAASEIG